MDQPRTRAVKSLYLPDIHLWRNATKFLLLKVYANLENSFIWLSYSLFLSLYYFVLSFDEISISGFVTLLVNKKNDPNKEPCSEESLVTGYSSLEEWHQILINESVCKPRKTNLHDSPTTCSCFYTILCSVLMGAIS